MALRQPRPIILPQPLGERVDKAGKRLLAKKQAKEKAAKPEVPKPR